MARGELPDEPLITSITLAEISVGPLPSIFVPDYLDPTAASLLQEGRDGFVELGSRAL